MEINPTTLDDLLLLTIKSHYGQKDKLGQPYILHPLRVMSNFINNPRRQILALMHDLVEDSPYITIDFLVNGGLPDDIIDGLILITRQKNETYFDYINRIVESKDIDVLYVKYYDLLDNMNENRIPENVDPKLQKKLKSMRKRYTKAKNIILKNIQEIESNERI